MPIASPIPATSRPIRRIGPAAVLTLLLGACSAPEVGFVEGMWSPFNTASSVVAADSLTVQRVRGNAPTVSPLLPEPGNVWPEQEEPRPALLGGPEEAFRNIPEYRPSLIEGAPPARSPVPTPAPGARRPGSGASLDAPPPPAGAPRFEATPPTAALPAPPPRSAVGQMTTDPSGRPAVITNEAGRIRGFTQPGLGGGAVIRDGNVETWIGPDGQTHSRVVPR